MGREPRKAIRLELDMVGGSQRLSFHRELSDEEGSLTRSEQVWQLVKARKRASFLTVDCHSEDGLTNLLPEASRKGSGGPQYPSWCSQPARECLTGTATPCF